MKWTTVLPALVALILFPMLAPAPKRRRLATSVHSNESGSTLTTWCKVGDYASGNEWGSIFLDMRDLSFLLLGASQE